MTLFNYIKQLLGAIKPKQTNLKDVWVDAVETRKALEDLKRKALLKDVFTEIKRYATNHIHRGSRMPYCIGLNRFLRKSTQIRVDYLVKEECDKINQKLKEHFERRGVAVYIDHGNTYPRYINLLHKIKIEWVTG